MRTSIVSLVILTVVSMLVGFVWLPSQHPDFTAKGVWDSICRAAGMPAKWGGGGDIRMGPRTTQVVLAPEMARPGAADSIGRGGTIALQQCTMCHGARGLSEADAPHLAGQYAEVVIKQLLDYKRGDRASAAMQGLSAALDERAIRDVAAYYASLPRPKNSPVTDMSKVPALVKVGDPMRNIAPCASCHGGIEQKLGAPWLEGMPKAYLLTQLTAFATGTRTNDSHAQMRNMARALTPKEIESISEFYAGVKAE
jgi:cytochrome c553